MASRVQEVFELTRVRVTLFLREPEALFWVLIFPLILAVVLGFAFRDGDVEKSKIVVLGGDSALVALLAEEPNVEVEAEASDAEAERKLRNGAIDAIVVAGTPPALRFDPARTPGSTARLRVLRALERAQDPDRPAAAREVVEDKTGHTYMDFLFPGLLGMNLMGTGIWGIGFAIADMRQKKLLKRLLVTPMRRSSFLLSFVLSRIVFLVIEVVVLLSVGFFALGVPCHGNYLSLGVVCLLSGLAFGGLGLLTASRAKTLEGVSGIMNLVMMPMWLCSGVFFSYERFPEFLHPILRLIPLTPVNEALRAVMLDGESLVAIAPKLAIIAGWGVLSFALAIRIFRWR